MGKQMQSVNLSADNQWLTPWEHTAVTKLRRYKWLNQAPITRWFTPKLIPTNTFSREDLPIQARLWVHCLHGMETRMFNFWRRVNTIAQFRFFISAQEYQVFAFSQGCIEQSINIEDTRRLFIVLSPVSKTFCGLFRCKTFDGSCQKPPPSVLLKPTKICPEIWPKLYL